MDEVVQQIVNAISLGGTYALLALGLAVVYSIFQMINFAHGALMTIAGYGLYMGVSNGFPFALAVVVALLASVIAAVLMERIAFRPLRGADFSTLLLSSFAVNMILVVLFQQLISARVKSVTVPSWLDQAVTVAGVDMGAVQVTSIIVTAIALVVLLLFFRRTRAGISMRAAASDFSMARLVGVPANLVVSGAFALSGLLAGIAGVLLVAQRGSVDPFLGNVPVINAFIAATIGGLGSLAGAVAGGFLLGAVEITLQATLPGSLQPFREAFVLSLVILIPLFRPGGLVAPRQAESSAS